MGNKGLECVTPDLFSHAALYTTKSNVISDWFVCLSWESIPSQQQIPTVYWTIQVKVKEQINDS